jgi:hypothetical protein
VARTFEWDDVDGVPSRLVHACSVRLALTVQELPGRVRLCLGDLARGDGLTLQDAADDLVQRLLVHAMAFRSSGLQFSTELGSPDLATMDFLYELGEIAAAGGDIRSHLFG